MKRRITLISLIAMVGVFALPRCSACWDNPDDPKVWVRKIKEAKSKFAREEALVNLYRIYELNKAMAERDEKYKKKLREFESVVNPGLVKVFREKINGRYVIPDQIVEKLVVFESDLPETGELFKEIVKKYGDAATDEFGDEDLQETLAAKAVDGLGKMAERGKMPPGTLETIQEMITSVCKKGGSDKGGAEGMDPRSFVRNSVVKASENFIKVSGTRPTLAKIMSRIVLTGNLPKTTQDPMVTLFAINLLGDIGDVSDESVEALVLSLLGKGRGRRYYSFAATSVAKLPNDSTGKHPAAEPLLYMLKGDPWEAEILGLRSKVKEEEAKTGGGNKTVIQDLNAKLAPLDKKYKEKKESLPCPYPSRFKYVCELFWLANVEDWAKTEPGVIQMNALMVLRELGEPRMVDAVLEQYGIAAVRQRWLKQAKETARKLDAKDDEIPGVQMQKMMIETYGSDMNVRTEMLRALGRMNAASFNPKAKEELLQSLTWAGDPSMMVKAGEGSYLSDYDDDLFKKLMELTTKAASVMMVNFKKMQVKQFFWGKVTKGICPEVGQENEKAFKKCQDDPPKLPGEKEIRDGDWNCFEKFKPLWLGEFFYAIQYFKDGDFKNLVHEGCRKTDKWWDKVKPKLEEDAKKGGKEAEDAKVKLFACQAEPRPEDLKKNLTVKCGQWTKCDASTSFLCLDGPWEIRRHFHKHASMLATAETADILYNYKSDTLMGPHNINSKYLPEKDKSPFFDSDDVAYLSYQAWSDEVEKARLMRAREILEKELCHHRRFLRVAKKCKDNLDCYVSIVKGAQDVLLETEDCDNLKPPYTINESKREPPEWRAQLKALRMLAHYGKKAGVSSRGSLNAIQAAIILYGNAANFSPDVQEEIREMVLIVIDRIGDYKSQKDVMCPFPYTERMRSQVREKYNLPQYEEKVALAKKKNDTKTEKKYSDLISKYQPKVDKEVAEATKEQPCYKILKLVIDDETLRGTKGSWQINRDARNALGRLARRGSMRFDEI